jgi:guanylate kinase
VLIGPRNVGRYELRDKLTNEETQTFCVPIAHTSRPMKDSEVSGQDYFFITKDTFEQFKKVFKNECFIFRINIKKVEF